MIFSSDSSSRSPPDVDGGMDLCLAYTEVKSIFYMHKSQSVQKEFCKKRFAQKKTFFTNITLHF